MNLPSMNLKPKLRGVIHQISFFVALIFCPLLIILAAAQARLGVAIYTFSLTSLFGTSALYHRINWTPKWRAWLRRLDHSMILLLIAGTATPVGIALSQVTWVRYILFTVWGGALLGICLVMLPVKVPKQVAVIPYLGLGWFGLTLLPLAWRELGPTAPSLLLAGGLLYSLGALAYARRSPNPVPGVFGYHEVFHAFVTGAAALHFAAIAVVVT